MAIDKNKLVSLGALQKAAEALKEAANKAAVDAATAEASRALAAEEAIDDKADANAAAIAKLNGGENEEGSVAKAVKAEETRAVLQEGLLDNRIKALEGIVSGDSEVTLGDIIADVAENTGAIAKLNGGADVEGSVAKAVADAVAAEATLRDDADKELDERVKPLETHVAAQPGVDAAQNAKIKALEEANAEGGAVAVAIKAAKDAADAADEKAVAAQGEISAVKATLNGVEGQVGLIARVEANEEDIARLDGDENTEGSVKKQIKDAIDEVNQAANGLEERVKDNENILVGLEKATVKAEIEAAQTAAEKHADEAIAALVDSAPEAMNTLNELAEAIKGNKDIYDGYVEQHAEAMAQQKADLQKEIDDDVKAVVDAQKLVNDAQKETNENFEARIAANEDFVKAQPGVDTEQDRRIKALEDANAEGGAMKEAVDAAQAAADAAQDAADAAQGTADAAQAAAQQAQNEVNAVEDRATALEAKVGHDVEGENPATGLFAEIDEAKAAAQKAQDEVDLVEGRATALESFVQAHDHSVMEQAIADNKAAIEAEVGKEGVKGARDAAIEAALEEYSTTVEMKGIIGAVIQSLNLDIVDNKVKLTLGSEENGVGLAEAELDMATDDDITAMLNELGLNQGEPSQGE